MTLFLITFYIVLSGLSLTGIFIKQMVDVKHVPISVLDIFAATFVGFVIGWLLIPFYLLFMLDKIKIRK